MHSHKGGKNSDFLQKLPENQGELRMWGLGGLAVIFIINMNKRLTQKLHRIILFHLGLITFRIHLGRTRKPFMFVVLGPSERDHDSQNQLILILETPRDLENPRKSQIVFTK